MVLTVTSAVTFSRIYLMAIQISDYEATTHRGISVHKKNKDEFLLRYYADGGKKRNMKIWIANKVHNKRDKLKNAYSERERLITKTNREKGIEADLSASVGSYFCKLYRSKRKLKRKRKDARTITENDRGWNVEVAKGNAGYYRKYIKPVIGHMKLSDVKARHISEINEMTAGFAPRTRKKAFEILMPLFERAIEYEIITVSPIQKSHKIQRSQKQEKRVVLGSAVEKYKTLNKAIHKVYADDPHHRALILFGFHGRRKGEVLQLDWSDIDLDTGTYVVRGEISKSGTDRTYELADDLDAAMRELYDIKDGLKYSKERQGKVFYVSCVNRHMTKLIRDESGIQEYTYHWMRNLAVSALSAEGVNSAHLSGLLGHTDLNTVKQYLSVQNKEASSIANATAKKILQ